MNEFWESLHTSIQLILEEENQEDNSNEWIVENNSEFYDKFHFLLIYKKTANNKCYFYFRYDKNNFETLKGIMINPVLFTKNKITGKRINDHLNFQTPSKSGDISIIYSNVMILDCKNDETIAKMASKDKKEDVLKECSKEILEYIKDKTTSFNKISSYMNSDEFKK